MSTFRVFVTKDELYRAFESINGLNLSGAYVEGIAASKQEVPDKSTNLGQMFLVKEENVLLVAKNIKLEEDLKKADGQIKILIDQNTTRKGEIMALERVLGRFSK